MNNFDIKNTFKSGDTYRDNFNSRVFGIFSEEIVRLWCNNSKSSYKDLGRPSLYENGKYNHTTLDFTFRNKEGDIFICEQKCEMAYQNYSNLTLNSIKQISGKKKKAFEQFLVVAKKPNSYAVKVGGNNVLVTGSILIWGSVEKEMKEKIKKHYSLHDILSIEDMINDLIHWKDEEYFQFIQTRRQWVEKLFFDLTNISSDINEFFIIKNK
jgi:hypothetical protein